MRVYEENKSKERMFKVSNYLVMGVLIMFGIFLWQLLRPIHVIDMEQPYPVINKQVRRGEILEYRTNYTKHIDVAGTVYKIVVCEDGSAITLPSRVSSIPVGEHKLISRTTKIPNDAPIGMCVLYVDVEYPVNKLRNVHYSFTTERFEIVE